MFKKLFRFLIIAPLLMATTCEDDLEKNTLVFNVYKAELTPKLSFSLQDTIWIKGKISSRVFDVVMFLGVS